MMDKPPSDTQIIQTFAYYWSSLQAEGQGMVMALLIAGLGVIYDGKKNNWRRDIAETLIMPLLFLGSYKAGILWFGLDERSAIPVAAVVAVIGLQRIRHVVTDEVKKRLP